MRRAAPLLLLLGLALAPLLPPAPPPALAADPPEKLRDTLLENAMTEDARVRAATALAKVDPEMLGNALLDLGEKRKDPKNLALLVRVTCAEECRHLRLLAIWAAWQTSPEGVIAAYVDRTAADDEKTAQRAVDAVGLLAPVLKDRNAYGRLFEVARGTKVFAGIEAVRGINRSMDRRLLKDIIEGICTVPDNHVRKHLVWALVDLEKEKGAERTLTPLQGRAGNPGKNAAEGVAILQDKQEEDFEWTPNGLAGIPDWWRKGRPRNLKMEIAIGDEDTKTRVQGFLEFMAKETPAWHHAVGSTIHKFVLNPGNDPAWDPKKKAIKISAGELAKCQVPYQGAYVLARYAGIALSGMLGEPTHKHRGWEPAYVDLHSFVKTAKRDAGALAEFVEEGVRKKPWGGQ